MSTDSRYASALTGELSKRFTQALNRRPITNDVQRELFGSCRDIGERRALRIYFTSMHGMAIDTILSEASLNQQDAVSSNHKERVQA